MCVWVRVYCAAPPQARFSVIGLEWIKRLEVTEMCALWMAAVLQTGSHLIKLSVTRRAGGWEEVKSGRWRDRESHHRENRQGRKDECSGAERGLRWRSETRETAGGMKEEEINRTKAEQDGDRDVKWRRQIVIIECANWCSDWCGRGGLEQYNISDCKGLTDRYGFTNAIQTCLSLFISALF